MNKLESKNNLRNWKEAVLVKKYKEDIKKDGLSGATRRFAGLLNLKPKYLKEGDENFAGMRERLNAELGLLDSSLSN